jgi:hypothetical protein
LAQSEDESASEVSRTPATVPSGMESSGEELLEKIRKLEVGQAQLKQEMSKLIPGVAERRRSQSVSPQRGAPVPPPLPSKGKLPGRRLSGGFEGGQRAWARGSASFPHSSPLQREGRATSAGDASTSARLPERQYSRVLQSLGQSVHILDLDGRIIYWLDFWFCTVSRFACLQSLSLTKFEEIQWA